MLDTILFSEMVQILDALHAVSQGAATVDGAWVKADGHSRIVAMLDVGLIAATGTLDLKLRQANTAGGGGAKDITGKAITQMIDTADNKFRWIELRTDELDLANGFFWVSTRLVAATAASLVSLVVLGVDPKYAPVTTHTDLIVTV